MQKFSYKCFVFVLPVLICFIFLETIVTFYPSTFNIKAKIFKKNLQQVEILVLGSSHNQNAINPEYFNKKLYNLAYGGQDIQLDSSLFFKYVSKMKSLNTVVLEYDFMTINNVVHNDYFRLPWYYRYYGVSPYKISLKDKISLYASSPEFFNTFLKNTFLDKSFNYTINEMGFITNDFAGDFESADYNISKLTYEYNHKINTIKEKQNIINVDFNINRINKIVDYCINHNINVVLISPPIFLNKNDIENASIQKMFLKYKDSISVNENVTFLDFQNDLRFSIQDFKNFDHLNSNGAKKYSLILNDYFNQLY